MLSVIIPTYNRFSLLDKCLNSLTLQTFKQAEFIIIDNGSTDNTKEVCDQYKHKLKEFRYFYEEKPGLHIGRHLGLKESRYDILIYADDDIEAFPTWLEGIQESFKDDNVALVGGKNLPKWETYPPYWIYEMWMNITENGHAMATLSILDFGDRIMEIDPGYVLGCNFSIRKSVLLEAGGFHPDAFPQDLVIYRGDGESYVSDFIRKKEYKTIYNPKASVYHFVPNSRMTLDYFCRRAFNQGISISYSQIRKRYCK